MSVLNPAAVRILFRAGRSPDSQRVPLSASGRITQARVLLAAACEAEVPVIEIAARAAIATMATFAVFFRVISRSKDLWRAADGYQL